MRTHDWPTVRNIVLLLVEFHNVFVGLVLKFIKCLDYSSSIQCVSYFSKFSMIHKFARSPLCLTIKVENENIKQHKTPYQLPNVLACYWPPAEYKVGDYYPLTQLPGQFKIIYSAHILLACKRHHVRNLPNVELCCIKYYRTCHCSM